MNNAASTPEILVVDDEPQVLTAIEDMLEDECVVHTATSPEKAFTLVRENRGISVIISDQRMPKMDGATFLSNVQSMTPATRILLTGYADLAAVVRAVNEGRIFAYLSKPWDSQNLKVVVHQAINYYALNQALTAERRLLHNLMESIPDAVYFKDRDHKYIAVNHVAAEFFGLEKPEEAIGRTMEYFLPAEAARLGTEEEAGIFRTGRPLIDHISRNRRPLSEPRWYSSTKAPVLDEKGRPYRLVCLTRDVTEKVRRDTENSLLLEISRAIMHSEDTKAGYAAIIMLIAEAMDWKYGEVWLWNPELKVLTAGPVWHADGEQLVAFRQKMVEHTVTPGVGLKGRVFAAGRADWVTDLAEGSSKEFSRLDWVVEAGLRAAVAVPVPGGADSVVAVLQFFHDEPRAPDNRQLELIAGIASQLGTSIAKKQAEDARRQSEERLRLLLDSAGEGIFGIDRDGRATFCNTACLDMLGYSSASPLIGQVMHDLMHHAHPDGTPYRLADCRLCGAIGDALDVRADDEVFWKEDGSSFPVEYVARPIWRDGEIIGTVVMFSDITERKQLETQLRQAQKMDAVGQLTGGVAHDFNNLLTVIMGNLQLLERSVRGTERQAKQVRMAHDAARRGADLTRRLLAFSRRQVLDPKVANVNDVIVGMEPLFRRTIGENIEIRTNLSPRAAPVRIDVAQLEHAVLNLVVNARDAMPDGGQISIATDTVVLDEAYAASHIDVHAGRHTVVVVSDTGCGIPKENVEHVFEPFFTTKDVGKGTGLGLSMVYGFLKQSGGHAAVYSEENVGTSVKLYFPVAAEAPSEAVAGRDDDDMPFGSECILVVEDDHDVRFTVVSLLESLGYQVLEAGTGAEGFEIIRRRDDIALVLTDVIMPGNMTGPELAAATVALRPAIKVLVTSGYPRDTVTSNGVLKQGVAFIGKPYEHVELARKLRELLDGGGRG